MEQWKASLKKDRRSRKSDSRAIPEITDDINEIKIKATKQNAEQVHLKDEMQHELKIEQKEEEPVVIKEEYKEK